MRGSDACRPCVCVPIIHTGLAAAHIHTHPHPPTTQFDAHQKTALVVYPETHEEEWINLPELVQERCLAVGE